MAHLSLSVSIAKTHSLRAYYWAALAVGMWAVVPVLRSAVLAVPTLQLTAIALASAALVGAVTVGRQKVEAPSSFRWVAAAGAALSGSLALYMAAFALAPAPEVSLIAYVWPILFSFAGAFLAGRLPGPRGLLGAVLAFGATAPLLLAGSGGGAGGMAWVGHLCALGSAALWAAFILLLARKPDLNGARMPAVCAVAAVLAGLGHVAFEQTVIPDATGLIIAMALGAGPYGMAFVIWGKALSLAGEERLTPLAYAVPVLSSGLAVAVGLAVADWRLAVAAVGVIGGAMVARGRPVAANDTLGEVGVAEELAAIEPVTIEALVVAEADLEAVVAANSNAEAAVA